MHKKRNNARVISPKMNPNSIVKNQEVIDNLSWHTRYAPINGGAKNSTVKI